MRCKCHNTTPAGRGAMQSPNPTAGFVLCVVLWGSSAPHRRLLARRARDAPGRARARAGTRPVWLRPELGEGLSCFWRRFYLICVSISISISISPPLHLSISPSLHFS